MFLYLPISVHGRVSDIWRSYIAQTVMHILQLNRIADWKLLYCPVLVDQYRNSHDYLADFESELPLYLQTHELLRFLHQFAESYSINGTQAQVRRNLPKKVQRFQRVTVAQILLDVYIALYEYGIVQLDDVR